MSTCTHAAESWTSIKSKNFFVVGNATEPAMRDVVVRLEQFRDAVSQLFPALKLDAGVPVRVVIFKDDLSYRPFKPRRTDGTPDDAVAGYFLGGDDVDYVAVSIDASRGDPYRTIFHEYAHYLLHSNTDRTDLPRWLDEGLAQYFETLQVIDGQQVLLGAPLEDRMRRLRRNTFIPLKTFFATDTNALQKQDDASRELFYAQAWVIVHYLMQSERAGRPVDRFLTLLGNKEATEDDLKRAFQIDYGSLQTALAAYIAQPSLPATTITLSKRISPDVSVTARPISNADAYLGDLVAHGDRRDEAEPFLRRAAAAGDPTGVASGALASLLIRQGKFAEAKALLEKAIGCDRTNFIAFFNLAYAVSHEKASADGKIGKYSPEETKVMRDALEASINLAPRFAENYHLLAFIDFVNGENRDEAVALLKKGITLKPETDEFKILLAQVLLTQDKYDEAKKIAADLLKETADETVRADAESVLKTIGDYVKARLVIDSSPVVRSPWTQSLIVLKRSWLTQADLDQIELNRQINNLNIILERPRPDEDRIVGTIESVSCSNGEISYAVRSQGQTYAMTSRDFTSLRMAVLLEGENSFQIDCGVNFAKTLAVIAFRPPASPRAKPLLTSISFVPDFFVLKSPEELASARSVVVEDDPARKTGAVEDLKPEARWAAIRAKLRAVRTGESRETGVLEKIDCDNNSVVVTAATGGKQLKLFSASPESVSVSWFSPRASQLPLVCGGSRLAANVVITFQRTNNSRDGDGELIALEFVPDGFSLSGRAP
jgi:tetratricopeptide (TPR) repeat protein